MESSLHFRAALMADALSRDSHWAHDPAGTEPRYFALELDHPTIRRERLQHTGTRRSEQLTYLGAQMVWLERSIHHAGRFDPESWRQHWLAGMSTYHGPFDDASRQTLENDGLRPSQSDDLSGASRIAPILDLGLDEEDTIRAARSQAAFTHGDPQVADAAEFFVRAVFAIRSGNAISEALFHAASTGHYLVLEAGDLLTAALDTNPNALEKTAADLGTTGRMKEAFPLSLYLAECSDTDFQEVLRANAMLGGATSARSMLLALLFAAREGVSILDTELLSKLEKETVATSTCQQSGLIRSA